MPSPNIVISQIYGGGGSASGTYQSDYIVLHNRSSATISVAGWSVQYASATGASWQVTTLTGAIPAGGYYLVREATGAGMAPLPLTPEASGTITMSATAGKIALANTSTPLSDGDPTGRPTIVDLVSYGATASPTEGAPAPTLSVTTALFRAINGNQDTDSNSGDFTTGVPNPQNSTTQPNEIVAPTFTSPNAFSAAENQLVVGTVSATDASGVGYAISGGADAAKFQIVSGQLRFLAAPDFEVPTDAGADNVYDLIVRATDFDGRTTDQNVAVTVTDVADAPDTTPPTVTSITRLDPDITNAATVRHRVVFSEAVTGVDAGDFYTNRSIASVTGSGTTYDVTLNTGADGDLYLDVTDNNSIKDAAGNSLGGPEESDGNANGDIYTVDKTAPALTGATPADNATAVAVGANIVLTFSEPVQPGTGVIGLFDPVRGTGVNLNVNGPRVVFSGSTITVDAPTDLDPGTRYQVLVGTTAVRDAAGNSFAGTTGDTYDFTTAALPTLFSGGDFGFSETNFPRDFNFAFNLSAPAPAGGVTFDIATADGTAIAGSDYVARALTGVIIPEGQTQYIFSVSILPDMVFEANETFFVNVSNVTGATLGDGQTQATIVNDDAADTTAPVVSSITRLDPSPTDLQVVRYAVTFSEAVTGVDTTDFFAFDPTNNVRPSPGLTDFVNGATVTGVSGSGADYVVSVNRGFGDGQLALVLSDDDTIRDLAANPLGGAGSGNGNFGGPSYVIDDTEPALVSSNPADNATGVSTGVTLSLEFTENVQMGTGNIVLRDSSGARPDVLVPVSDPNQVAFQTNRTVLIDPTVNLDAGVRYQVLIPGAAIRDAAGNFFAGTSGDQFDFTTTPAQPTLNIADLSVVETDGVTTATVTVTLSGPAPAGGVTFDIATANGTATQSEEDYAPKSLTGQTIPAGAITYNFTVQILGDGFDELDETFLVNITNIVGATAGDTQAVVTILDDDSRPVVTLSGASGMAIEQVALSVGDSAILTDADDTEVGLIQVTLGGQGLRAYVPGQDVLTVAPSGDAEVAFDPATGVLTITGSDGGPLSLADAEATLQTLLYTNTSNDPAASDLGLSVVATDPGGNGSAPANYRISVTPVNDAPTVSLTALNPTYNENGAATTLFSNAAVSAVEASQSITQAIFTVTNVQAGDVLQASSGAVTLTNGASGLLNGLSTFVTVSGTTATVTVSPRSDTQPAPTTEAIFVPVSPFESLLNSLAFRSTSENPSGSRVVTLTSVRDDGGVSFGGQDTRPPNIASTVTLAAVNDLPVFGYEQGFASDTAGFTAGGTYGTIQRVQNGANGIPAPAPDGDGFFAIVTENGAGPFTNFGTYASEFANGLQAGVKVYLDTAWALNQGFQYTVAANGSDGAHQRDFGFQVRSVGGQIQVGAANGASFEPITFDLPNAQLVTESGWYELRHVFRQAGNQLAVDMYLIGADGAPRLVATLSDPADTIPGEVGGNRYGWFTDISVPGGLAIDDVTLGAFEGRVVEVADGPGEDGATYAATGAIAFNDIDVTDTHTVTVAPAGPGYRGTFVATVSNDTASTAGDTRGAVTWTFNAVNADLDTLAPGQVVVQTYLLTLRDSQGGAVVQEVDVTLVGANEAPTATNDIFTVVEDAAATPLAVLANDSDVDGPAPTVTAVTQPSTGGSVSLVNGVVSFTPAPNFNGQTAFTYTITDANGATATATATVNVTAVNDAPTVTPAPGFTVVENGQVLLQGRGIMVADVDGGSTPETLTVAVGSGTLTAVSGAGVTAAGGGSSVTLTGTIADLNAFLAGGSGSLSYVASDDNPPGSTPLTLTISDNGAGSPTGTPASGSAVTTITLTSVNDAPTAAITADRYTATEGQALNLKGQLAVGDVDGSPPGGDPGVVLTLLQSALSKASGDAALDKAFDDLLLDAAPNGLETVSLIVTEGALTVTAGGSGAVVTGSGTSSVRIRGSIAQLVALLSTDATSTISYLNSNGAPSASATLVLAINDGGNTGSGGAKGASDTAAILITAVNSAPTAITGGPFATPENAAAGTVVGSVSGTDPDNASSSLVYSLPGSADGRFAISAAGEITVADGMRLDFEQAASHQITVRATDPGGLFVDRVFTVGVTDVNPETPTGGAGADLLYGGSGADVVSGGFGDDTLYGGQGDDVIYGNQNDDALYGNQGADVMYGGQNNDGLFGGQGDDVLYGNLGDDLLQGGLGADSLFGNGGADVFRYVLAADSTVAVFDTIFDFEAGIDDIDLRPVRTGPSDTYVITSSGGFTTVDVDLGGNGSIDMRILLAGQPPITADDILFS